MIIGQARLNWRQVALGAFAALSIFAATPGDAADAGLPDRAGLVAALREGRYADLDAELARIEDAVEARQMPERNFDYAFHSFAISDPDLEAQLDEWVASWPQSFAARFARGRYHLHLADISWRATTVSEVPPSWRAAIDGLVARSADDITIALDLKPGLSWAYSDLARMARDRGDRRAAERLFQAGLAAIPDSGVIYGIALESIDVSTEEGMRDRFALIDSLIAEHGDDPNFLYLRGYKDSTMADRVCRAGNHQKGIELATRAIRATDLPSYIWARAEIFRCARRPREAIADYDTVLERTPGFASAYYGRGKAERSLNLFDAALLDYDRAVDLDPLNPKYLASRAWVYVLLDRIDEAQADFEQALVYGKYDSDVLDGLAYLQGNKRNDWTAAADIYQQLSTLEPDRTRWFYMYGFTLMMAKDCRAIEVLDRYMAACKAGAYCGPESDDWQPHPAESLQVMLKGLREGDSCAKRPSGS